MSKKSRKQKEKSRLPLIIAIAGGILVVATGIFLATRGGGNPQSDGTPEIVVDNEVIDYGDVKLDTPLAFTISISNMGDGVLRFKEAPYIQVQEGC